MDQPCCYYIASRPCWTSRHDVKKDTPCRLASVGASNVVSRRAKHIWSVKTLVWCRPGTERGDHEEEFEEQQQH